MTPSLLIMYLLLFGRRNFLHASYITTDSFGHSLCVVAVPHLALWGNKSMGKMIKINHLQCPWWWNPYSRVRGWVDSLPDCRFVNSRSCIKSNWWMCCQDSGQRMWFMELQQYRTWPWRRFRDVSGSSSYWQTAAWWRLKSWTPLLNPHLDQRGIFTDWEDA